MFTRLSISAAAVLVQVLPLVPFAQASILSAPVAQSIGKCTSPGANSFECARELERMHFTKSGRLATRQGATLIVQLANRRVMLQDARNLEVDGAAAYSYIAFDKTLSIHVIHVQRYESDGYMLLHHALGQKVVTSGYPIGSPDGGKLLSISEDMFSGYNPNNIEIWSVLGGEFKLESRIAVDWGPRSGQWLDTAHIRIQKECYVEAEPGALKPCGSVQIEFRKDKWSLVE